MKIKLLRQLCYMSRMVFYGLVLQLVIGGVLLAADSRAQLGDKSIENISISIKAEGIPLKDVLNSIESNTGFNFTYNTRKIDEKQTISVSVDDVSLGDLLREISRETKLKFKRINDNIHIAKKNLDEPSIEENITILQERTVTGKILSMEDSTALPGVNVVIKGTMQGTVTDIEGQFSIDIPSDESVLVFSSVGFLSEEIKVGTRSVINLTLSPDITALEEIVVIGYGTVKKADLTGAVAAIAGKDIQKNTVVDPVVALQGKAAGVTITPVSGQPGADIQVMIRGIQSINASNSPIYIIDGIISESMGSISLNDIEDISILKDASSTAIYGSRAANGVVVITTKRGKKGAPVFSFHTYQGIRTPSNLSPDMLNSNDYLHLLEESYANSGQDVPNTGDLVDTYYRDANGNIIDTDWLDVIMRTGSLQYYDLSLSGGGAKSNYFISANYLDEKGVVIGQGQDRLNFRFNSDYKINKYIDFGNTLNLYSHKNFGLPSLNYTNYPNSPNPYLMAMKKTPLSRPYEEDGSYGYTRYEGIEYRYIPPHLIANEYKRNTQNTGFQGNLFLRIKPFEGLTFTPRISIENNFTNSDSFTPTVHLEGTESINVNHLYKYSNKTLHWQADFLLEYETTFLDNHNLKALFVYSQEESQHEYLSGSRDGTPINAVTYLNAADPSTAANSNGYSDWSFVSYLGRLNYDFKGKYLLQGTVRFDGSSRFSEDNRWGTFPSVSAGWRISDESFFEGITNVMNDFKIRASFGTVGNSNVGNYPTYSSLGTTTYVLNETVVPAFRFQSAVNTDLKWETTLKKDFGFDAAFLDSKITLSTNYFIANTKDLLFSKPLPASSGKSGGMLINGGEVMNKGIEFELGFQGSKGDFSYSINGNITHQKNEVVDLLDQDLITSGLIVGSPAFSYYGFVSNGIIKTQADLDAAPTRNNLAMGDVWLVDLGGEEGVIDSEDKTIIGNRYPNLTYGLVSNFSYKQFSLGIQLQGVNGIDLPYNTGNYFMGNPENNRSLIMERWHETENPDGNMPKIQTSDPAGNFSFSDFWLSNASYLRINNVTASYDFPKKLCNSILLQNAQLYFTVQNLYTFTKSDYRGVEVDMLFNGDYYGNPSLKMPIPRTWTMGLKVSF